ncbi:MAG: archaeosine synthase subunit alpha [Methanotrichaceae archaeon]
MTKYFEVTNRDGPARRGRLLLERVICTPDLITKDDLLMGGPLWKFDSVDSALEKAKSLSGQKKKLLILPYVPAPLHTEPPIDLPEIEVEGPSGIVVHPFFDRETFPADVYVLGAAGSLRNPHELVKAVLNVKNVIPPDTALYAPALATPANLALLIYMGIDLVDVNKMIVDGYLARYHTRDRMWQASDLAELPCRCQHCQAMEAENKRKPQLIAKHNCLKLEEELRLAREFIRQGTIREYVERQVRVVPELTTALRLLDQEHQYLEQRTPISRRRVMYSNTAESLQRIEVTRFAQRVLERYKAPESDLLLLLPCSARKPYSRSRSHRLFAEALGQRRRYVHEVILTSPLALVPRELEEVYPAAHYDVPVTGRWDLEERDWILKCLDSYLKNNQYTRIVAHLDGELREMVENHGIDAIYTGGGTNKEALKRLRNAVEEAIQDANAPPLDNFLMRRARAMTDYYFGKGAGDLLLVGNTEFRGRELLNEEKKTLASITPQGMVALSLDGAKRLEPRGDYVVKIGNFLPRGDVLSPGVSDADEQIRPGDEVIVCGDVAFGVGRAKMSGWEMVESSRGVAVELRHVI